MNKKIQGISRCKEANLQYQGNFITHIFFPFNIKSVDAILGVDWFCKLREITIN